MKRIYLSLITIISLMGSAYADRLVIKGSDTLGAKLVPQLAEQFKAQHPGTTFDIAAEGSTTGIAAIIDGTAQIGMSSRRAKSSEVGQAAAKGINMKPTVVAYDGIAVAPGSQKMAGNEQIASEVGRNPAGIGYVGMAYTKAGGVKVVSIDGASPSIQSVQNHSYPYWRPTFYYTNGEPGGIAKTFLDFTLSSVGQKIVNQVGFVPIK